MFKIRRKNDDKETIIRNFFNFTFLIHGNVYNLFSTFPSYCYHNSRTCHLLFPGKTRVTASQYIINELEKEIKDYKY